MAWVAGADVSTGQLITAAQWNNYMGTSGSLTYLKGQTDRLDNLTHSEPSRALDTIYHNTTGKIKFVTLQVFCSGTESVKIFVGSATPPTTFLGYISTNGDIVNLMATFPVLPDYYYKAEIFAGAPTIQEWHEWDLH